MKLMAVNKEAQLMQTRALPQRPVAPYHERIVPGWLLCLIIINVCHRAFAAADLFKLVKVLGLESGGLGGDLIFAASEVPDSGSVQNSDIHKGVNGFIGDGGL